MDAVLSVTPYYNKPNRRGILAHFREVAKAARSTPVDPLQHPRPDARSTCRPDLLAELAQIDGIDAVKQANWDELQLIDGLAILAGNDDIYAKLPGHRRHRRHLRRLARRRARDAPHVRRAGRARRDRRVAAGDLRSDVHHREPRRRSRPRCEMLGQTPATLRLPLVECDEQERNLVHNALAQHGLLARGHRALSGTAPRPPAGRRRRDRQEHDRRRVRRAGSSSSTAACGSRRPR